ncbi:MAG: DUF2087 domain-containing protein [Umezawaea sp.]
MTPELLVGLLAEPERLRVVAAVVLGARTPSEIATAAALDARVVVKALGRLEAGGLVSSRPEGVVLHAELFKEMAAAAPAPVVEHEDQVLRTFVRGGRLVRFPAQDTKRRTVLEHVAASFETGRRYPEPEVNAMLVAWCEGGEADHVALRRYLVDAGLLHRDAGLYWRAV